MSASPQFVEISRSGPLRGPPSNSAGGGSVSPRAATSPDRLRPSSSGGTTAATSGPVPAGVGGFGGGGSMPGLPPMPPSPSAAPRASPAPARPERPLTVTAAIDAALTQFASVSASPRERHVDAEALFDDRPSFMSATANSRHRKLSPVRNVGDDATNGSNDYRHASAEKRRSNTPRRQPSPTFNPSGRARTPPNLRMGLVREAVASAIHAAPTPRRSPTAIDGGRRSCSPSTGGGIGTSTSQLSPSQRRNQKGDLFSHCGFHSQSREARVLTLVKNFQQTSLFRWEKRVGEIENTAKRTAFLQNADAKFLENVLARNVAFMRNLEAVISEAALNDAVVDCGVVRYAYNAFKESTHFNDRINALLTGSLDAKPDAATKRDEALLSAAAVAGLGGTSHGGITRGGLATTTAAGPAVLTTSPPSPGCGPQRIVLTSQQAAAAGRAMRQASASPAAVHSDEISASAASPDFSASLRGGNAAVPSSLDANTESAKLPQGLEEVQDDDPSAFGSFRVRNGSFYSTASLSPRAKDLDGPASPTRPVHRSRAGTVSRVWSEAGVAGFMSQSRVVTREEAQQGGTDMGEYADYQPPTDDTGSIHQAMSVASPTPRSAAVTPTISRAVSMRRAGDGGAERSNTPVVIYPGSSALTGGGAAIPVLSFNNGQATLRVQVAPTDGGAAATTAPGAGGNTNAAFIDGGTIGKYLRRLEQQRHEGLFRTPVVTTTDLREEKERRADPRRGSIPADAPFGAARRSTLSPSTSGCFGGLSPPLTGERSASPPPIATVRRRSVTRRVVLPHYHRPLQRKPSAAFTALHPSLSSSTLLRGSFGGSFFCSPNHGSPGGGGAPLSPPLGGQTASPKRQPPSAAFAQPHVARLDRSAVASRSLYGIDMSAAGEAGDHPSSGREHNNDSSTPLRFEDTLVTYAAPGSSFRAHKRLELSPPGSGDYSAFGAVVGSGSGRRASRSFSPSTPEIFSLDSEHRGLQRGPSAYNFSVSNRNGADDATSSLAPLSPPALAPQSSQSSPFAVGIRRAAAPPAAQLLVNHKKPELRVDQARRVELLEALELLACRRASAALLTAEEAAFAQRACAELYGAADGPRHFASWCTGLNRTAANAQKRA